MFRRSILACALVLAAYAVVPRGATAQTTQKPVLHGKDWMAITGKPLGATAGAMMFLRGGNAVDAACAMLGATATMWDVLGWGGETQALIYNPETGKVIGINALGAAPSGATPEFFREQGMDIPPAYGPLAAVTPGTPGGLMVMLAEYGRLSLAEVLEPAIDMARGYPIEAQAANAIEREKERIAGWPYSKEVFLPHYGEERAAPSPGEIFVQEDLARTLEKLVETEAEALAAGATRRDAIMAAYNRFYRGDIAEDFVRASNEAGGLHTLEDLANWQVYLEEPVATSYKGIDVYKLTTWVQGPVLLQALNILEGLDVASMGYNSTRYVHALYQAMNLAFADRDFYYGDPYYPPEEPIAGLLSKEYAASRAAGIDWERNDPDVLPGDPYPFQGGTNPFLHLIESWNERPVATPESAGMDFEDAFHAGTTSIQAADADGWVVSVTPSGAWIPAVIAGRTGIGMSQRMQSFVLDERAGPYNVVEPGKRPRATLTPLAGAEGRASVPLLRRSGRRRAGSEPAPVLPERRRVRDERAAGGRGGQLQQLPDAEFLRGARIAAGEAAAERGGARVGARRAGGDGVRADLRRAYLRADQRDLLRRRDRDDVGRFQQSRGGLRDRMVTGGGEGGAIAAPAENALQGAEAT